MSLYRGAGGASDATDDSTVNAVAGYASSAASSASAAAASASTASSNADAAAASAASAATNVSQAASSASNALTSASNASTSAANAASSASAASSSATAANVSAGAAATSAANAATSNSSASTHATNAANSATAAAGSATSAANSASSALAIYGNTAAMEEAVDDAIEAAANAQQEAQDASDSAVASAASAAAAYEHEQNAGEWASQAQGSANNAALSASSALSIFGSASAVNQAVTASAASATASAASATNSANSATASANSATAAAASATTATTQATNAAASAAAASAVVLGNEPVRPLIRPSLLLDFANTKQLDPRITFTRASTGTFYDGRTVAKAEENLLQRSEEFENAYWTKLNTTVTANASTAPNGTSTADKLVASATTGLIALFKESGFALPSQTVSIYVKAVEYGFATVSYFPSAGGSDRYAVTVNLSTGAVTQENGLISGYSNSVTSVGSGWYRVTITSTNTSTNASLSVSGCPTGTPTISSGVPSFTGDGTSGILIWGAQLEQRGSVTAYTPTTTAPITNYIPALQTAAAGVPRFEHNPVTGVSLGLEIEEQRANLLVRSEEFDNASWTKFNATITANANAGVDGALSSDLFVPTTTSGVHALTQTQTVTAAAHTQSVYAKAGGYSWLAISMDGSNFVYYDLVNGALGTVGTNHTATITPVGNGWYRCTATQTFTAGSRTVYYNVASANNTVSFAGNGFSGIYLWGAQVEVGAFATSYIQTVASQVTRSADSAVMTGTNFSSWYRADEGTLYAEAAFASPAIAGSAGVVAVGNGTTAENIGIFKSASLSLSGEIRAASATQASFTQSFTATNCKGAVSYRTNSFNFSTNAAIGTDDTAGAVPAPTSLFIGGIYSATTFPTNGTIRKIAFYPARVTNAQLQSLTTV